MFLLNDYFILKVERERQRDLPPTDSFSQLPASSGWGWSRLKWEARSPVQISHVRDKHPILPHKVCTSRELQVELGPSDPRTVLWGVGHLVSTPADQSMGRADGECHSETEGEHVA